MDESRPGLLTIALAAALGASALASGPGTAVSTPAAAVSAPVTAVSAPAAAVSAPVTVTATASTPPTTSLTGTVPLTAVPWGGSFERYLRLLQDADASVEQLEKARAEFESALGPASGQTSGPASVASTAPGASTSASPLRTSR